MQKLKVSSIITGVFFLLFNFILCIFLSRLIYLRLPGNDFRAILTLGLTIPLFYCLTIFLFRIFIALFPLKAGEIQPNSTQEFIQNIHVFFYTAIFSLFIYNNILPVFIMRPFYQLLGAQLGENTFCSGTIFDAQFVTAGKNTLMGLDCVLIPHVMEGAHVPIAYFPINIGDDVTIGARAIIHAGVTIGNGSMIASGAVVSKHTSVGSNEIWGGIPARLIKKR